MKIPKKTMEYKVIEENDLSVFEQTIQRHLVDGWRLHGSLSFSHEYRPTFEYETKTYVHYAKPCYVREMVRESELADNSS